METPITLKTEMIIEFNIYVISGYREVHPKPVIKMLNLIDSYKILIAKKNASREADRKIHYFTLFSWLLLLYLHFIQICLRRHYILIVFNIKGFREAAHEQDPSFREDDVNFLSFLNLFCYQRMYPLCPQREGWSAKPTFRPGDQGRWWLPFPPTVFLYSNQVAAHYPRLPMCVLVSGKTARSSLAHAHRNKGHAMLETQDNKEIYNTQMN